MAIGQGGIGRIEVADDGCGMSADEMALALERHCTSKLPDEAIESVVTLGFRGEALPSIASVARVTIESRPAGRDGWSRVVDNGEVLRDGPAAVPPGTRIVVEDLFARVPARRKFLRSPRSEYAACLDMVRRLAMARPDIAFTLEHDGRRVLTVPGGEERPGRVAALTDRALAENLVAIDWVRDTVSLGGVAGLPTFNRGIADHQYLFVNGRPVRDRLPMGHSRGLCRDVATRSSCGRGAVPRHAPSEVDVNVHPAKTEVRFRDPALIRGMIVSGLRRALDEAGHRSVQRPPDLALAMWQTQTVAAPPAFAPPADNGSQSAPETRVMERQSLFAPRPGFAAPPPLARAEAAFAPPPEVRQYPMGSRAARSPRPISSPKPRTGWFWSTSMPRTSGWCWNGCAPR